MSEQLTNRYYIGSVCGDAPLFDKEGGCLIENVNSCKNLSENMNSLVALLNKQDERIKELENEKEVWKSSWGVTFSENNILNNELGIAIEQGYQVTAAFKEYRKSREALTDD